MIDWNSVAITLAPDLWLALAGVSAVVVGAIWKDGFTKWAYIAGATTLFIGAGLSLLYYQGGNAFDGMVRTNQFVNFAKFLGFALAGVTILLAKGFLEKENISRYEYPLLIVFACLGMGVMLSSADLMVLYLGIEILSLSSYVLAAYNRRDVQSSEAGLKYFVLGALASGILIYGASLVYGFTGSTRFDDIANSQIDIGFQFGMVLMITGLAFKVSAAPMHVWTPDVYQGAPTPVVTFFATAPKLIGVVLFANVLFTAFAGAYEDWRPIIAIISALSMLVGAFGALLQTNLKRLLGYASIANVGYALVAVAAGPEVGAEAVLLFMSVYALASLGLFSVALSLRQRDGMIEDISGLAGLVKSRTGLAIAFTILLVSVSGFPLAVGFIGKLGILEAALNANLIALVIVLIFSSVVAFGYYLKLIFIVWIQNSESTDSFERTDSIVLTTVFGTAFLCLALFFFSGWLQSATQTAISGF